MKNSNLYYENRNFYYAKDKLPDNYETGTVIDAGNKLIGFLFTIGAGIITFGLMYFFYKNLDVDAFASSLSNLTFDIILIVSLLVYTYLHEIVHGIVYWRLTGIKPTFGLKLFCAFCGLPETYVCRSVIIKSVVAPLIVFSALFIPAILLTWHTNMTLYLIFTTLFSCHLGGCIGDIFVTILLLTKYRDPRTLSRDTGPCQTLYVPTF